MAFHIIDVKALYTKPKMSTSLWHPRKSQDAGGKHDFVCAKFNAKPSSRRGGSVFHSIIRQVTSCFSEGQSEPSFVLE